ncbi:hypothetical protein EV385_2622 [Krasilnikovia cinnamomea]|uniref:DUF6194 domain-containing protein n=1 Tax=Krasilnikovia cinnamomea TaxID=349313 RepID=A0A4V2G718_9ACTN|nr:DUF6194 family protein [Krasilnikovia cinnamomea]RZU50836.1 hypothetical protein EV385_2622 [Krasilnikovia cinnamomea]
MGTDIEERVTALITALPGVVVLRASAETGAPEVAWGDSFFYYDPRGDSPADRRMPFATLVTNDYPGFDTASHLHRPGVVRLNLDPGRALFTETVGYAPAEHPAHADRWDYTALDQLLPHPVYATAGWVSVLNPGPRTRTRVAELVAAAHARAARHDNARRARQVDQG